MFLQHCTHVDAVGPALSRQSVLWGEPPPPPDHRVPRLIITLSNMMSCVILFLARCPAFQRAVNKGI